MSKEITVIEAEVTEELSDMRNSIQALEGDFSANMSSENGLEMTEKFNEINTALNSVLEAYQRLLTNSEEMTRQSVEVIKETDSWVSSEIQLLK